MIPHITSTPTVLAAVMRTNGVHPEAAVRAALQHAGIPPDAPYAEWCDMVGRALTLLPRDTKEESHG